MAVLHSSRAEHEHGVLNRDARPIRGSTPRRTSIRTVSPPSDLRSTRPVRGLNCDVYRAARTEVREEVAFVGRYEGARYDSAQAQVAIYPFKRAIELCPCDHCPQAAMCCDLQLACRAFAKFVRGVQWRNTVRKPTHKRYLQLFASDARGVPRC
jgi:hypothetical protein